MELSGVILAGGQNTRMSGRMKALLVIQNESFIERQIRLMKPCCTELIIVTHKPSLFDHVISKGVTLIEDEIPGKGPLSGMHAAFNRSKENDIWVVGCDMPFISSEAASLMHKTKLDNPCEVVIPRVHGRSHPLHGIYDKRCAEVIAELLDHEVYRVNRLLQSVRWMELDESIFTEAQIDLDFVSNINTIEDYNEALTKFIDK